MNIQGKKISLPMVLRHSFMALTIAFGLLTVLQLSSYLGIGSDGPFIRGWVSTATELGPEQIPQAASGEQMKLYEFGDRKLVMVEFSNVSAMMQLHYLGYIFFQLIPWLLGVYMLYQLFSLFRDMDRGKIFPQENVRRIRRMATAVLVFPVANYISGAFLWNIVQTQRGQSVSAPLSPLFLEPILQAGFIALILFSLAEVFRHGFQLQQEQDLTI
ncbi:MAG TPA: DUF2975 domain-containing protein [Saprospiraceae bacterium]|nr:DUF2975 domain-containing protein [Saprospiraceae bacterium]